jgi:hypothetical protein
MRINLLRAGAVAGALVIIATSTAVALAQGPALTMEIADRSVEFGAPVKVAGATDPALAGRTVDLQFAPDARTWTTVATTAVGQQGRYRFARSLPRSGALRVRLQPQDGAATASTAHSVTLRVAVSHRIGFRARRLNVTAGRRAVVAGRVSPAVSGVAVSLQARRRGRWVPLDRARTSRSGAFDLRDRAALAGSADVRVVAAPKAGIRFGKRGAGRLNVYRVAHASWYGPGFFGRQTGCGGRLGYSQLGVAHKTLPCGTRVTFRHRGRIVTVPVIDRGPYVGSREYDLTAVTAQRLGFRGHGPILVTR